MYASDRAGFEEFVRARRPALRRIAYLLVGNHDDADDLVQVALAKAAPHWRRIADRPEPYVRQILGRESISRWRRRRWREETTDQVPERAEAEVDHAARLALERALDDLSPRQRAVLVLRYYEDLTERETAAALGLSVSTVKSHGRDAVARLRVLLGDEVVGISAS